MNAEKKLELITTANFISSQFMATVDLDDDVSDKGKKSMISQMVLSTLMAISKIVQGTISSEFEVEECIRVAMFGEDEDLAKILH